MGSSAVNPLHLLQTVIWGEWTDVWRASLMRKYVQIIDSLVNGQTSPLFFLPYGSGSHNSMPCVELQKTTVLNFMCGKVSCQSSKGLFFLKKIIFWCYCSSLFFALFFAQLVAFSLFATNGICICIYVWLCIQNDKHTPWNDAIRVARIRHQTPTVEHWHNKLTLPPVFSLHIAEQRITKIATNM